MGISEQDQSILSGVIQQYLGSSQSGSMKPFAFQLQAYTSDKNSQNTQGTQASAYAQAQYNNQAYQQPNYYYQQQQQQYAYDYNSYNNYKQQQYQREQQAYEQKL